MPRSKNPNPRQVMEGETAENAEMIDSEQVIAMTPDPMTQENMSEVENVDAEIHNDFSSTVDEWKMSDNNEGSAEDSEQLTSKEYEDKNQNMDKDAFVLLHDHDFSVVPNDSEPNVAVDNKMKPERSVEFSALPRPSFFSLVAEASSSISRPPPPPLKKLGQGLANFSLGNLVNGNKKPKSTSPSVLNPEVMIWMRNRFQIRPGGRISASDIIALYGSDTKHLPNPPPGLHNYQVGQLLRRVFPNITRCKITVNSKRLWVYRHLNLNENPPENLFEEQDLPSISSYKENGEYSADAITEETCRGSDSPMSNVEETEKSPSPVSVEEDGDTSKVTEKKSNAILLGLLGNKYKTESPLSVNMSDSYGTSVRDLTLASPSDADDLLPRKKRDSEVMEWLRENYKYKPGYYVKSMDLLRQYNHGREELVKYLSQVGRVMKHVFPSVRHLRKSFKGGKREWVYLNLKPIEVDSDSEEGKRMLMPNPRGSTRIYPKTSENSSRTETNTKHQIANWRDWKRERVNITHTPLSLVQNRNAIFKPKGGLYHRVSRIDGNKLVISRNPPNAIVKKETAGFSSLYSSKEESCTTNTIQLNKRNGHSPNKTRIILYNQKEMRGSQDRLHPPMELERDIFAPFDEFKTNEPNSLKKYAVKPQNLAVHPKNNIHESTTFHQNSSNSTASIGVFSSGNFSSKNAYVMSSNENSIVKDADCADSEGECWASKRLRLCAEETATGTTNIDFGYQNGVEESPVKDAESAGLDLSIKRERDSPKFLTDPVGAKPKQIDIHTTEDSITSSVENGALNLTTGIGQHADMPQQQQSGIESPNTLQTLHYKPETSKQTLKFSKIQLGRPQVGRRLSADSVKGHFFTQRPESRFKPVAPKLHSDGNLKRSYVEMSSANQDIPITFSSLQNFNAQRYGWLRSPNTSWSSPRSGDTSGRRVVRFVEWFLFSGQWLFNNQRAMREIKIYDDWTVVLHALGRRVYPNDLGGITDLEKTASSLNKVFRVLAEAKLCMGFPAPSISDLYIHGILVSKFEVWSSREDSGEDIRQRAVNCQILYSGTGACCNKCARIMKLHQQQKRGAGSIKRANTDSNSGVDFQSLSKHLKI